MSPGVRVGLLDSGLRRDQAARALASRRFLLADQVIAGETTADRIAHGSVLAEIIWGHAPEAGLLNGRIFDQRPVSSAAVVAAGLDWLTAEGAGVVNMSFGLREDRAVLRDACAAALAAGVILVAAAPARGRPVFPASYAGVIRVCGDARCAEAEISHLATAQADFGACPRAAGLRAAGGASFAAAHVSGMIAARLAGGGGDIRIYLDSLAKYHGPERRS